MPDYVNQLLVMDPCGKRHVKRDRVCAFRRNPAINLQPDPALTDDQILDALQAHPILMQRPIVACDKGVRLCRPMERVHEIVEI